MMSIEQHETFLKSTHVPLRLSVVSDDEPLIVPLWFVYEGGALWCACQRESYLVRRLSKQMTDERQEAHCAFDISTNTAPYQGVAGAGYVTLHMDQGEDRLRSLIQRYLNDPGSPFAQWLSARATDEVALRIRPTRVRAWDFTNRMSKQ